MSPTPSAGCDLSVATEELAVADDALALRADVDEDLVLVDPDDRALDDVPVLEALDVAVLLGEQLLHRGRLWAARERAGSGASSAAGACAISVSSRAAGATSAGPSVSTGSPAAVLVGASSALGLGRCLGGRFLDGSAPRQAAPRLRPSSGSTIGVGGIVRDHDGRVGLLGRRGLGGRLGRRRRPALLLFGQLDALLQSNVPPRIRNGPSPLKPSVCDQVVRGWSAAVRSFEVESG